MDVKAIRTEHDYDAALSRIENLMDAKFGTPEGDELDVLTTLVSAYENEHHFMEAPNPIEYVKNAMEFKGFTQNDLAELLNSRPRASELLHKQRPLTLEQIRKINSIWGIPAEPLIQEYTLSNKTMTKGGVAL